LALLIPALLLLVVFVASVSRMVWLSLMTPDGFTMAAYRHFFATPVYRQVLFKTFRTAGLVTLCTIALGYPLSYLLSQASIRVGRILTILVVLPFFTSVMVRTYAWIVMLGRHGLVNEGLQAMGLLSAPLGLLYNSSAVLLGMTYVMLPYMVLTVYATLRGIDPNLLPAAHSLGAGSWQTFRRVVVPLSLPGVLSGSLLVFLLSLGFFITPALMGGPADVLLAMLVEREIELTANWGFGAAMAVILLAITLAGVAGYYRLFGVSRILDSNE